MKRGRKNRVDHLIEALVSEFSKIPNFEMVHSDSDTREMFDFIVVRFFEIADFRTLYKNYFIPAASRALVDTKREISNSAYKGFIRHSESELKENYYETILLGYVGLFHKIENYVKDLLRIANQLFSAGESKIESIENFYGKRYGFKFNDWYSNIWLHKINWISNCVKHYDGYPRKEPKYRYLSHLNENQRIRIDHQEFYEDLDYVVDTFYKFKLTQVLSLALFKMAAHMNEEIHAEEWKQKYTELEDKMKKMMI